VNGLILDFQEGLGCDPKSVPGSGIGFQQALLLPVVIWASGRRRRRIH
jgi:hypothetical protein